MENIEIAGVFNEVADLLEIQDANPFRIRAYRNAARTVGGLTRSLSEMVAEGEDLTRFSGIGDDIAGYITELVETGSLAMLAELEEEVPETVTELLRLEGVGPKRARKLYEELGVESVDDLEEALDAGRVRELEGFGAKTAEKIRRSIQERRKHGGRVPIAEADQLVRPLLEYMRSGPGVEELEVAGSYRRRRETVGDIDLLAVCDDAVPLMEHFTSYGGAERVEGAGETRGTVVLRTGLHVDLRIVSRASYGAALHYFTGSKEHNVAVRKRGVARGLKVNEYGVFEVPEADGDEAGGRGDGTDAGEGSDAADGVGDAGARAGGDGAADGGERIGGATEEEVFAAVGLVWTPPELREDRGEIEAAEAGELPELVTVDDIRGDLQMHSTWSDGKHTIRRMAEACRELGYEYLAITDHSQRVAITGGLDEARAEEQWEAMDRLREELDGIHLFRSMEVDILEDGSLDLDDAHLAQLDIVLVSVHSYMNLPREAQTERIVTALAHPEVDVLAHPTGRRINKRRPYDVDVEALLHAAKEHGVAVELNANPERLDLNDLHVLRAKELGVPVVISTDAHSVDNLRYMSYGVDQGRRGWLEPDDVLNARPLDELRAWLEGS